MTKDTQPTGKVAEATTGIRAENLNPLPGSSTPQTSKGSEGSIIIVTDTQTTSYEGLNLESRLLLRLATHCINSQSSEHVPFTITLMEEVATNTEAQTQDSLHVLQKTAIVVRDAVLRNTFPTNSRPNAAQFVSRTLKRLIPRLRSDADHNLLKEIGSLLGCLSTHLGESKSALAMLSNQIIPRIFAMPNQVQDTFLPILVSSLTADWLSEVQAESSQRQVLMLAGVLAEIISHTAESVQFESQCAEECLDIVLLHLKAAENVPLAASILRQIVLTIQEQEHYTSGFTSLFRVIQSMVKMPSVGWDYADEPLAAVWKSVFKCGIKLLRESFPHLPESLREVVNLHTLKACEGCNTTLFEIAKYYHGLSAKHLTDVQRWIAKAETVWEWYHIVSEEYREDILGQNVQSIQRLVGKQESSLHHHDPVHEIERLRYTNAPLRLPLRPAPPQSTSTVGPNPQVPLAPNPPYAPDQNGASTSRALSSIQEEEENQSEGPDSIISNLLIPQLPRRLSSSPNIAIATPTDPAPDARPTTVPAGSSSSRGTVLPNKNGPSASKAPSTPARASKSSSSTVPPKPNPAGPNRPPPKTTSPTTPTTKPGTLKRTALSPSGLQSQGAETTKKCKAGGPSPASTSKGTRTSKSSPTLGPSRRQAPTPSMQQLVQASVDTELATVLAQLTATASSSHAPASRQIRREPPTNASHPAAGSSLLPALDFQSGALAPRSPEDIFTTDYSSSPTRTTLVELGLVDSRLRRESRTVGNADSTIGDEHMLSSSPVDSPQAQHRHDVNTPGRELTSHLLQLDLLESNHTEGSTSQAAVDFKLEDSEADTIMNSPSGTTPTSPTIPVNGEIVLSPQARALRFNTKIPGPRHSNDSVGSPEL
ncbi:hypothetical protein SISSUDRAFT_1060648 [Sistotremastrum suecicum HHB10207 ss-3]|uniref:Uncharacterized protein n=1 Tax=Sistotremastrum suecicum HHB10207 ss-3 TaxID=1314776 RepID=A0A166EVF6_9AGAM|nr:hypothetical protein SISSUDRAFT_1060648 [Sistotremastrum suecicum HHB10207 ss-3]